MMPRAVTMGATIAEPVIIAVVPEPWGNLIITPMIMGIRMPGIPVATVAINGAMNAGILAVQMLAVGDEGLKAKMADSRSR